MDVLEEIINDIDDKDIAIYYLFHICKSPKLLAYKNLFYNEPSNVLSALVKVPLFYKSDVDDYVTRRYNKMCTSNPKRFLSIIQSEINNQHNRLIPSCLNNQLSDHENSKTSTPPNHLSHYSTIKSGVLVKFDERDLDKNGGYITPKSVTKIADSAFEYCLGLKHLIISSGVTHIGDCAFAFCENLETIKLPTSLTTIGNLSFFVCKNLKTITIPKKVTSLEFLTFSACLNLEEIVLHDDIKKIAGSAFVLTNAKPINLPENFKEDWNDKKFKRVAHHCFHALVDAIRERNNIEPLQQ